MYSFNATVTLPDDTPMTAHQLIQATLTARTYATAQQEADAKSRFYNAVVAELIVIPADDILTGDAFRRVTNGVCDSNFDENDLTSDLVANAVKKISPCALSNRVFYQNSGGNVNMDFECSLQ